MQVPFVQAGIFHQLYADNLKCTGTDSAALLLAKLVGQEASLSKCILLTTSWVVWRSMKSREVSDEKGWADKLDFRDLGGPWPKRLGLGHPLQLVGCPR